ncbi:MAG: YSIRK-type signal peptide-containing protein, partial [Ligilactobacillus animalis]|uniref:Rib/alpha-like domain-containing protein n=1 Tax=Ligilactobacillus animalis TaxID=1605 RepID=UPI00242CDA5F
MQEKQGEHYRKWSIKRLSIGVVSVSVAAGIFISSNLLSSTAVLADENASVESVVVDEKNETKQADEIKQTVADTAESTPEVADVPEKVVATEASEKDITQEKVLDKTPVKDDATQEIPEGKENFARVATASIDISEPKANAVNESTPLDNAPKTTNTPIDIDAIESGKVTTGGQLTNANQVVSGWVELAPTSWVGYTPGTGGATKLDGYTVYLQWIDTDGAMSPLYSAKTHDLAGAASNGGGQGTFAFDLPTFTDANGVEHKFTFIPTSSQRLKMWLAPGQISADGNELITFRPVVGNTPGFSTPTTAGAFYLAGANLQRASIYVAELPSTDTLNKLVGDQKNWRYDDAGPDSNPGLVGQGTNRVSGSVWWETSKNGTTFPTSTGENFVDQTADEAKTGFRVVTAALTPEGIAALKSTQDADNVNDKVKEQLAILAAHPEYIQEVVVAPVIDGKYTAHFTDDIDTDGLYQFILNPKGEVQTAYSNYPVPAYGHPRQYTHSNPYVVGQQVYNSHFALVPNLENYNIEITNFDTTTKTALPGDKAVSDVNAVFSAGQVTEIVWQAGGKEISRTEVTNLAEAKKAAEFTVPADMDTDTIYMVELVVNGVTVDADSFLAKMPTDADKYTATGGKLEKGFGEATTEAEVVGKVTTDYPKDGQAQPTIKVKPGIKLPDGTKSGEYKVPVVVTYPDGSTDETEVAVTVLDKVIDQTADPSQPTPKGYVRVTFAAGTNGSFAQGTSTVFDVKAGTALTELTLPKVTANKGYAQKTGAEAWGPALPTKITAAGTYTAQYVATQSDADKYTATGDKLEKGFGEATTEAEVVGKVTTDYPKDGQAQPTIKVKPGTTLPDGTKSGEYKVPVVVTYPDGSTDETEVAVTVLDKVIDQTADPSQPTPKGYVRVTFAAGTNGSFAKGTSTVFDVKAGTALTELTLPKVTANKGYVQKTGAEAWSPALPTTITAAGTYTAQYKVAQNDAEKYTATGDKLEKGFGEATTEAEVFAKVTTDYPADAAKQPTFKAKPYGGSLPDGTKPGKYTIPVEVTYPDGTMDKVNVIVTVLDKVIDQTADPSQPTPKGYVRVTFAAGTNGSFVQGTSTVFDVKVGTALTELTLPKVTANKGYTQKAGAEAWSPALPTTITAAGTYTAQYVTTQSDADKYAATGDKLEKGFGEATTEAEVFAKVTTDYPADAAKQPIYKAKPYGGKLPDGTKPGKYTIPVEVTYPDGTMDKVNVIVTVLDKVI